jgi:serine carboxypeptidase-like clade 1
MALISDELYKSMERICKGNYVKVDSLNTKCYKLIKDYQKCIHKLNKYHILLPDCDITSPDCFLYRYTLITFWANNKSVREALQVNKVYANFSLRSKVIYYFIGDYVNGFDVIYYVLQLYI